MSLRHGASIVHLLVQLELVALAAVTVVACGNRSMGPGTLVEPSPSAPAGETIFADDFESGTLNLWEDGYDPARHRIVTEPVSARSGARFLAATYPAGGDGEGFAFRTTDTLRLNPVQLTFSADADTRPHELHVDNLVVRAGGR